MIVALIEERVLLSNESAGKSCRTLCAAIISVACMTMVMLR